MNCRRTALIWYGASGGVILLACLIYAIPQLQKAGSMQHYCRKTMLLDDDEVSSMPWDVFVRTIADRDPRLLGYNGTTWQHLVMIITRKHNYMVALYNQRLMNVSVPFFPRWRNVTLVFEWCFDYATRDLWTDLGEVNPDYIAGDYASSVSKLRRSFVRVGLIGLLTSPLVLIVMTAYAFFTFLEQVRNSPGVLFTRTWSALTKWQIRCFDEVDCCLTDRLSSAFPHARGYTQQFKNPVLVTIAKFVVFALAVLLAPLVLFSLVAEDVLQVNLWGDPWPRKVIYVFTLLATLIAIFRAMIPGDDFVPAPQRYMAKTLKHVRLPAIPPQRINGLEYHYEWVRDAHAPYVLNRFNGYFKAKYLVFLSELAAVITVPFIFMYSMYDEAGEIIQFLRDHTVPMGPGLGTKFIHSGLDQVELLPAPRDNLIYEAPLISGGRLQYQGMTTVIGTPPSMPGSPPVASPSASPASDSDPLLSGRNTVGTPTDMASSAPSRTDAGTHFYLKGKSSSYGPHLDTREAAFRDKVLESVLTFGGYYPHWNPTSTASAELLKSGEVQQYGSTAYRPNPSAIVNDQMISYMGARSAESARRRSQMDSVASMSSPRHSYAAPPPSSKRGSYVPPSSSARPRPLSVQVDLDEDDDDDQTMIHLDDFAERHAAPMPPLPPSSPHPRGDENV